MTTDRDRILQLEALLEYRQAERALVMAILGQPGVAGTDTMADAARAVVAERDDLRRRLEEFTSTPIRRKPSPPTCLHCLSEARDPVDHRTTDCPYLRTP